MQHFKSVTARLTKVKGRTQTQQKGNIY